jgi:hypothetical protein
MPIQQIKSGVIADNAVTVTKIDDNTSQLFGPRNKIINGDMRIAQRGTTLTGVGTSSGVGTVDRFLYRKNDDITARFTMSQSANTPSQQGFTNSLRIETTTANSYGSGSDYSAIWYAFENNDKYELKYGTASAKPVTLSFWMRSNVAGNLTISLQNDGYINNAGNTNIANYAVTTTSDWTKYELTFEGDTILTPTPYSSSNAVSRGLTVWWFLDGSSGTRNSGTVTNGSWQYSTLAKIGSGHTARVAASIGNYVEITGVQLEVGSVATPFERRPYGTELASCQRYFNRVSFNTFVPGFCDNSTAFRCAYTYPVQMRSMPTMITSGTASDYGVRVAGIAFYNCDSVPTLVGGSGGGVSTTRIDTTVASGFTTGHGGFLASSGDSAFLSFNAEL